MQSPPFFHEISWILESDNAIIPTQSFPRYAEPFCYGTGSNQTCPNQVHVSVIDLQNKRCFMVFAILKKDSC